MSANITVVGKIIQVIPWEQKTSFFGAFAWPTDAEYDMIYCAMPDEKVSNPEREQFKIDRRNSVNGEQPASIFHLVKFLVLEVYYRLGFGKKHSFNPFVPYTLIPVWVKRPHSFQKDQSVELSTTITAKIVNEKLQVMWHS